MCLSGNNITHGLTVRHHPNWQSHRILIKHKQRYRSCQFSIKFWHHGLVSQTGLKLKVIAHWVQNFHMRFFFGGGGGGGVRIRHPFLSKCLLRMRKHRKSNLVRFFYDGRKFRRQCVNVIDTMWGRIYFPTCENFRRKIQTQCAMALSQD